MEIVGILMLVALPRLEKDAFQTIRYATNALHVAAMPGAA